MTLRSAALSALALPFAALPASLSAAVISPNLNAMTSSFFQGTDRVRGYAGDSRPTFRVSTDGAFGLSGAETIYMGFYGFNPADYTSPVSSAILSVTSIDGGQGASNNASAEFPFFVTAHGVSANPFTSITDNTNPGGTISWSSFYHNNILTADPAAGTSINGFGTVDFDVTALINSWIDGTNNNYVIALTGKNDTSGRDFLHGFRNNTEAPGSTFLMVVPEPGSTFLLGLSGMLALGSRRRKRHAA